MPRKSLAAKPESPIVPVALKLKELGYDPIWLYAGKGKQAAGWPEMANEPDDIRKWRGRSVALRMSGHPDLTAFDMDVPRQDILDSIILRWTDRWPEFMGRCLIRHSGAVKVMLIGRMATERKRMYSARYGKTDDNPAGNRVEVFTCNDRQYIGVWGVHSKGRDYGYDGPEITEVGYSDLPVFLEADLNELLTIANEVMEAAGLAKCEDAGADLDEAVFDLTPDMRCEPKDLPPMTLEELEEHCQKEFVYVHGRLFDPGSDSYRVKCKVTSQGLTIWDFGTGITHFWQHLGPQPAVLAPLLLKLAEAAAAAPVASLFQSGIGPQVKAANTKTISGGDAEAPPAPLDGAGHNERLLWLTKTYGYCALNDTVVAVYEPSMDCEWKPGAFARRFAAWYIEVPTRGGVRKVYATEEWAEKQSRFHIDGARMHPGQSFPLYQEHGKLWKNVYQRPRHEGTGDLSVFWAFFNKFIPDVEEREWLLNWMAHKQARPDIPGSAIILVADNDEDEDERVGRFGTGRGSMFKILHRLYGVEYSRGQSFSVLDGTSSQSAYNSWIHGNVLVTVDETKTSATAHRRGEKKSVYEVLKDLVDPAPKGMTFNVKYGRAFWGYSYCSFWLATNHIDALSIPKNDRRFTVLENGPVLTPGEGRALAEWMEVPGNIAELSRFLAARDLAGFNMFQHLETRGKEKMIEHSRSSVEELLMEMIDDPDKGLVFTKQQMEHTIEDIVNPWEKVKGGSQRRRGGAQWRGEFAGAWNSYCVGLKTETGSPWRVRVGKRQVNLYCFRKHRTKAGALPEARRRHEAAKWGLVDELKDLLTTLNTQATLGVKDE
jgi:hypothetical protein